VRTLQPLSTSMPITCHARAKVSTPPTPDLLERVLLPQNAELLRASVLGAIASIEAEFFDASTTSESRAMRITATHADHVVLLALFMLLLNVDAQLKEHVVAAASGDKKHKVVRLLEDLRQRLVLDYFTNEEISTNAFVGACEDCYVIS